MKKALGRFIGRYLSVNSSICSKGLLFDYIFNSTNYGNLWDKNCIGKLENWKELI